jgi:hypothetical protein
MMEKYYLIGVGGSGAKCVRAALHLHSAGAYGNDVGIGILLVDADPANGNLQKTRESIELTIKTGEALRDTNVGFFNGQVKNYGFWNPLAEFSDRLSLSQIYREQTLKDTHKELGELLDLLISPEEKQADLSVGFRGRPSIGSAIVSRIDLTAFNEGPWAKLVEDIKKDCQNGLVPRIHLFGSIFGGTGSSGLPTLGTLLSRKLSSSRAYIKITASVLLPYFDFDRPSDEGIYAESNNFTLNSDAALQYLSKIQASSFNCIYLIGNSTKQRYRASTGGSSQNNPANIVELIAATAIEADTGSGFGNGAYLTVSEDGGSLTWDDIPGKNTVKALQASLKTSFIWYSNLYNELRLAQEISSKTSFTIGAPWFDRFFSVTNSSSRPDIESTEQNEMITLYDKWSVDFLSWFKEVCWSGTERYQLAQLREYKFENNSNGKSDMSRTTIENIEDLLITSPLLKKEKWRNSIDLLKNELADSKHRLEGIVGLINHLYEIV